MEREGRGLKEMVAQQLEDVVSADVTSLSSDDADWLGDEPSATPDISWIEDDLQKTPVGDLVAATEADRVPFSPELSLTPPPLTRAPIRRPVIERVRRREAARVPTPVVPRPAKVAVAVAVEQPRGRFLFVYGGAIAAGVASGLAVILLGP